MSARLPSQLPYGVYDTMDKCWLGDDLGPMTFTPITVPEKYTLLGATMAALKASIINEQFGHSFRFRARLYDGTGNRIRDTITAHIDGYQALARIERRAQNL